MTRLHQIFAETADRARDRLVQRLPVRPARGAAVLPEFYASNSLSQLVLNWEVSRVKFASLDPNRAAKFHASNFEPEARGSPVKRGGQAMPPPK